MGENGQGPQGSKSQLLGHQIAMWLSSGPREGARLGTSLGTLSAAWRAQWGTPPTRCPAPVGTSGGSRPLPSATSSKLPDSSIELECEESLSFDRSSLIYLPFLISRLSPDGTPPRILEFPGPCTIVGGQQKSAKPLCEAINERITSEKASPRSFQSGF